MTSAEDVSKAESFPLRLSEDDGNKSKKSASNINKPERRLSFHQSVSHLSPSGTKLRSSLTQSGTIRNGNFLQLPVDGDVVNERLNYQSQRANFDSAALRQIIWIVSVIGLLTGLTEFIVQSIAHSHQSFRYEWSIGFWSGVASFLHALVGLLTLKRSLRLSLRCKLAKSYFFFSGMLAVLSIAEMTCAVVVYSQAADVINMTNYQNDREYKVKTMEISVFNSLLSGCGLIGVLVAIFAAVVNLQRLNIELKIAQSFTNLVSRRNSTNPAGEKEKPSGKKEEEDNV